MLWFGKTDDNVFVATRKEQHEAIENLIESTTLKSGYYMLLVLAACIVTPGLLIDNVAVIIGGMILAPLIIPLLSISLALVAGSLQGFLRSLRILFVSLILTMGTAALLTFVLARAYHVVTWIPEQIDPALYIFIAFCSGVAGAFAFVKKNLSSSIAGVAVAVSLLPPLCAAGIGLALGQFLLMQNSLMLFAANLIGICMAAVIVFLLLGFLDTAKVEEKVIENQKKENGNK